MIQNLKTKNDVDNFLRGMFTDSELEALDNRYEILKLLKSGYTQRQVAEKLNIGIGTVTRGAHVIKTQDTEFIKENEK